MLSRNASTGTELVGSLNGGSVVVSFLFSEKVVRSSNVAAQCTL